MFPDVYDDIFRFGRGYPTSLEYGSGVAITADNSDLQWAMPDGSKVF